MSKEVEQEQGAGDVILFLDPDDILIPDESNVRPYVGGATTDDEQELEDLAKLGQSIATVGQLQPVVVIRNLNVGGPQYSLIAGRRRTKAVKMYNLGADEPIKLKAIVDPIKHDKKRPKAMFQHALHENVHRKNLNPIQFALNIKTTRGKMTESKGAAATQKIAEFFGVSPAAITQAEKLLDLPQDLQAMVASAELSAEAAQEVIKHGKTPEERKLIVERAKVIQAAEDAPETAVNPETGNVGERVDQLEGRVDDLEGGTTQHKKRKRKSKGVKAKNVRTAAREVTGSNTKRSRTELLDFFRWQLGPVNGHPNGAIHLFCDGLLSWAEGKLSDKKLNALWDDLVQNAYRGKAEPKVEAGGRKGAAGKPAPKKKSAKSKKKK